MEDTRACSEGVAIVCTRGEAVLSVSTDMCNHIDGAQVFRTRYGAPARVSLSEAEGKTETEGYGILAVHRDDFERYYFDADKFKHKWGGEDVDLVGRMVVTNRKIGIVRTRGEHVVHIWHPPFNNTKWYESFTTGAKIQVVCLRT